MAYLGALHTRTGAYQGSVRLTRFEINQQRNALRSDYRDLTLQSLNKGFKRFVSCLAPEFPHTSLMNSISVGQELRDQPFSGSLHLNVRPGRGHLANRIPGAVRERGKPRGRAPLRLPYLAFAL